MLAFFPLVFLHDGQSGFLGKRQLRCITLRAARSGGKSGGARGGSGGGFGCGGGRCRSGGASGGGARGAGGHVHDLTVVNDPGQGRQ